MELEDDPARFRRERDLRDVLARVVRLGRALTWRAWRRDNCRSLRRISLLLMPVLLVVEFLAGCGGDGRDSEHPLCADLKDVSVAITDSRKDTKNSSAAEIRAGAAKLRAAARAAEGGADAQSESSGKFILFVATGPIDDAASKLEAATKETDAGIRQKDLRQAEAALSAAADMVRVQSKALGCTQKQ